MKISEQQLLILLDITRHVIDCNVVNLNFGYSKEHIIKFYENIMSQQNEIVDTHRFHCRSEEYLRLALDLYESLEGSEPNFKESGIGKRATEILYPKREETKES